MQVMKPHMKNKAVTAMKAMRLSVRSGVVVMGWDELRFWGLAKDGWEPERVSIGSSADAGTQGAKYLAMACERERTWSFS